MILRRILALSAGVVVLAALAYGGDWPQFRGSNGGVSDETQLPTEWSKDKNIAWTAKVPGYGWSSPIVWGDRIFLTTADSDKQKAPQPFNFPGGGPGGFPKDAAPKGPPPKDAPPKGGGQFKGPPGGGFGGMYGNPKPPDAVYRLMVYCLDASTGKVIWKQVAAERKPAIAAQMGNTYASETPVTDGERVYAYFGMHGLYCYDMDGKLVWSKDLGSYPMMMGWGTGSSPALDGDRLFIQCDNEEKSFLIALDKKTGKELWRKDRDEKSNWSTPFVWRNKVRTEIVTCGGKRMRSYDPADGKLLWELGGKAQPPRGMPMSPSVSATPAASDELLFVGRGNPFGDSPLWAVKAGAAGDISPKEGETSSPHIAWSSTKAGPPMASPLLYEGQLYILSQYGGFLVCLDPKTGKELYRERLPGAKGFTSSPWAYAGKVFCLADDGKTFVVQAGPEFKLLGKNELDDMCWSTPAPARGALFLRGRDQVYCIKQ